MNLLKLVLILGLLIIFRNKDNMYRIEHQTLESKIHL